MKILDSMNLRRGSIIIEKNPNGTSRCKYVEGVISQHFIIG